MRPLAPKSRPDRFSPSVAGYQRAPCSAALGPTDVPKKYMEGKQIDPMITHVMPVAGINAAFELMKPGLPSQRW
jgi:Zn-dependent alcohol dehydrogenase